MNKKGKRAIGGEKITSYGVNNILGVVAGDKTYDWFGLSIPVILALLEITIFIAFLTYSKYKMAFDFKLTIYPLRFMVFYIFFFFWLCNKSVIAYRI